MFSTQPASMVSVLWEAAYYFHCWILATCCAPDISIKFSCHCITIMHGIHGAGKRDLSACHVPTPSLEISARDSSAAHSPLKVFWGVKQNTRSKNKQIETFWNYIFSNSYKRFQMFWRNSIICKRFHKSAPKLKNQAGTLLNIGHTWEGRQRQFIFDFQKMSLSPLVYAVAAAAVWTGLRGVMIFPTTKW